MHRGTERYQTGENIRKAKQMNTHRLTLFRSICFEVSLCLIRKCFMLSAGSALCSAHLMVLEIKLGDPNG